MMYVKVQSEKLQGPLRKLVFILVLNKGVDKFYLDFMDPMHIKKLSLEQVINNYKNGHSEIWAALLSL
jgi:hypothetical protein